MSNEVDIRTSPLTRIAKLVADRFDVLEARVAKLERDAASRTASNTALDRWARIVGLTDREPSETNEQLRARIDEATARVLTAASELTGIPRHLLAGTEPAGLSHEYPASALAIGTRVRIDDKSLAWHDEIGTVSRVPGPGDAPDVFYVDLEGGTITIHRAHLALVDDTLPECGDCHGVGEIALFTGLADCPTCGGSGVVS